MNSRLDSRAAVAAEAPASARALRRGSSLHGLDYEVVDVLHDGAFGITYLARGRAGGDRLAIKEYMPAKLAWRAPGGTAVATKSPRHDDAFKAGLRAFTNEARLLSTFEHPSVVRVLRFWKEHGTAYMAMPAHDGTTLRQVIGKRGAAPDEAELRGWIEPLLDGLAALHAAGCVHGDITPDSILLTADGPLLLGFGGGRRAIGQAMRAPLEVLPAGYAALEQYSLDDPSPALGPATDLYALSSVLCAAMTGRAPLAAPQRLRHDDLVPIAEQVGATYTPSLAAAVDAALAVEAGDRPQGVEAFRAILHGTSHEAGGALSEWRRRSRGRSSPVDRMPAVLSAAALLCVAAFAVIGYLLMRAPASPPAPTTTIATGTTTTPAPQAPLAPAPTAAPPLPVPSALAAPAPATTTAAAAPPTRTLERPRVAATVAKPPAPVPAQSLSPECSELIQRASLQTLAPEEAQLLRKECKK